MKDDFWTWNDPSAEEKYERLKYEFRVDYVATSGDSNWSWQCL